MIEERLPRQCSNREVKTLLCFSESRCCRTTDPWRYELEWQKFSLYPFYRKVYYFIKSAKRVQTSVYQSQMVMLRTAIDGCAQHDRENVGCHCGNGCGYTTNYRHQSCSERGSIKVPRSRIAIKSSPLAVPTGSPLCKPGSCQRPSACAVRY